MPGINSQQNRIASDFETGVVVVQEPVMKFAWDASLAQ